MLKANEKRYNFTALRNEKFYAFNSNKYQFQALYKLSFNVPVLVIF